MSTRVTQSGGSIRGYSASPYTLCFIQFCLPILAFSIWLGIPNVTEARPEFAAELGKDCTFCHIEPTGGGPRNRTGEIFEENYFEFPKDFNLEEASKEAQAVVKQLTTSLELQTAFIKTTHVDESENTIASCNSCHSSVDRFLLMQAEVTFNAHVSERMRLTLSNNVGTTRNAFATVKLIQEHLYVKVGQFPLPFGIKQRDHNILIREGYGLGSNKHEVGLELGGSAGKVFYNAAFFNAKNTIASGGLGTVGGQLGPLRAGISGRVGRDGDDWEQLIGLFVTAAYAGVSVEGEFNFGNIGERGKDSQIASAPITPDAFDSKGYYVGARYRIHPQLSVAGRYGLFDADRNIRGDAAQRITLSVDCNFMENGALSLFYWANLANSAARDSERITGIPRQLQGTDEVILMSRFWF